MRLDFIYRHDYERPIIYRIEPEDITPEEYEKIETAIYNELPDDDYTREELDDIIFTVLSNMYTFPIERIKTFYF